MGFKNFPLRKFIFFSFLFITFSDLAFAISPTELAYGFRLLFNFLIQVGVILGFFSLILGGILYVTSFGNPARLALAKKQILGSFLGLLILFSGWYIIRRFRPEFTKITLQPIDFPVKEVEELRSPSGLYLAIGELPIETYLKGKEGINSYLFNKTLLEEILNLLDILKPEIGDGLLDILAQKVEEFVKKMHECKCDNTIPEGIKIAYCLPFPPDLICVGRCWVVNGRCCGDPCEKIRGALFSLIDQHTILSEKIFETRTEIEKKIHSLSKILAEIYYILGTMEKCPYNLTFNRDYYMRFIDQLKKQAPDLNWEISRIPLLKEIDVLRVWSFADFYCPKTGIFLGIPTREEVQKAISQIEEMIKGAERIPEEREKLKEIEDFAKRMEQELSPEYELPLSCPFSIPFGESVEKLLIRPNIIRNNLREITEKLVQLINKVKEIHQASFKCSSRNCKPSCKCVGVRYCDCVCECEGKACPMAEVEGAKAEFYQIYGQLVQLIRETREIIKYILEKMLPKWGEIEMEVRKKEKPLTLEEIQRLYAQFKEVKELVTFEIVAVKYHYCLAQVKEVEAEFRTTPCEISLLSLNPENKKIATTTDCKCQNIGMECKVNEPIATSSCEYLKTRDLYRVAPWLPEILQLLNATIERECYYFNSFCCRYEKPPVKPQ